MELQEKCSLSKELQTKELFKYRAPVNKYSLIIKLQEKYSLSMELHTLGSLIQKLHNFYSSSRKLHAVGQFK